VKSFLDKTTSLTFWGVDYYLRRIPGVIKVEVGYTGGVIPNPYYEIYEQTKKIITPY
jgi:peptide methionine sulfoxide reductase MsrA